MMGETLAQTICDNKTQYKPGHWFNSAKFIDIEYQLMVGFGRKLKTMNLAFIGNMKMVKNVFILITIKPLENLLVLTTSESECVTNFSTKF